MQVKSDGEEVIRDIAKGVHIGTAGTTHIKDGPKVMVTGKQKNGDIKAKRQASVGIQLFCFLQKRKCGHVMRGSEYELGT